jgi:hypothetical protein
MTGNELTLWSSRAQERQHLREMEVVHRRGEQADTEIDCVARTTKRAIFRAAEVNMVRAQAERIAPDGAEHYALLAGVGVTEMAMALGRMTRGW